MTDKGYGPQSYEASLLAVRGAAPSPEVRQTTGTVCVDTSFYVLQVATVMTI